MIICHFDAGELCQSAGWTFRRNEDPKIFSAPPHSRRGALILINTRALIVPAERGCTVQPLNSCLSPSGLAPLSCPRISPLFSLSLLISPAEIEKNNCSSLIASPGNGERLGGLEKFRRKGWELAEVLPGNLKSSSSRAGSVLPGFLLLDEAPRGAAGRVALKRLKITFWISWIRVRFSCRVPD